MATSALGRARDVDVVATLYQEDEWLRQLTAKDDMGIWQKRWFPHNYEVTAFEAYEGPPLFVNCDALVNIASSPCWHSKMMAALTLCVNGDAFGTSRACTLIRLSCANSMTPSSTSVAWGFDADCAKPLPVSRFFAFGRRPAFIIFNH